MMEQEFLKERTQSHQSHKTFFVNKLLTCKHTDDILEINQWGINLGYDLNLKRVACIFTIKNLCNSSENHLNINTVKNNIIELIKMSPYHTKQDISSYVDINRILVLKTITNTDDKLITEQLINYLEPIQDSIRQKYELSALIGIGSYREDILNLRDSFSEAQSMLNLAEKTNVKEGLFFIHDYILEYFYHKVHRQHLDHFLKKYKSKLHDKPEIVETIHSLVNNSMNISETSKELFIHRNTVLFRINKIKELLDIDPLHNDKDRILLRFIDLYIKFSS
jgi:carbohydrate diacid regulator